MVKTNIFVDFPRFPRENQPAIGRWLLAARYDCYHLLGGHSQRHHRGLLSEAVIIRPEGKNTWWYLKNLKMDTSLYAQYIYICIYIYVYIHAIKFTYITHAYIICTPKNGEKRIWIDETPHAIKSHIDIAAGPFPLQAMSTLSIDHSAFGRVLCECFPFGNHRLKPSLPRTWPRKNHTLLQCVCVCACVCLSAKYYVYLENHPI